jgi:hypothetical protein
MIPRAAGVCATGVVLVLAASVAMTHSPAQPTKPAGADKLLDLTPFPDIAKHYVAPVTPKKDPKSGFVVGGKNDTTLIRGLTEINGRTIADIEADMRPGAKSEVGSSAGFLGPDEKLLEVLAIDNRYVVDEMGLTHQDLARHLHAIGAIGRWQKLDHKKSTYEFVYHGRRFKVTTEIRSTQQPSPFRDGDKSGTNITLENLDNGKKLGYALLVPFMIERYGFYEGKGTPYRVEPSMVLEVLDFLVVKGKKG